MRYLAGATVGAVRGLMSVSNVRGPLASLMHANLRLSFDQTLENATGVGTPPWTWPRDELLIDVSHKALYALVRGTISDALIPPSPTRHGGAASGRARRGSRSRGEDPRALSLTRCQPHFRPGQTTLTHRSPPTTPRAGDEAHLISRTGGKRPQTARFRLLGPPAMNPLFSRDCGTVRGRRPHD